MFSKHLSVNDTNRFKVAGYATVCVVCLGRITECQLQKCSGCKLVFYCGKEHQKSHWPKHKDFCRAVQLIIQQNNNVGLFDDENYTQGNFKLDFQRMLFVAKCEINMKRQLSNEEKGLFTTPFICKVCHIHKHQRMITCKNCCVISYCSKEHQLKDQAIHSSQCHELKYCLDFDTNFHKSFSIITNISDVKTLPTNMRSFIHNYVEMKMKPCVDELYVGPYLSNSLTVPLTIIYAIEKGNIYKGQNSLVVHVVGSGEFENRAYWCWEYIFYYFKTLRNIHLIFIGPENKVLFVPPTVSFRPNRSIRCTVVQDFYHNYAKHALESPNVIVAFNCGFYVMQNILPCHDIWGDSLPVFCSFPGAIVVLTATNQMECVKDLEELRKHSKTDNLKIIVECADNPFKSLLPNFFLYNNPSYYYTNNFISILST